MNLSTVSESIKSMVRGATRGTTDIDRLQDLIERAERYCSTSGTDPYDRSRIRGAVRRANDAIRMALADESDPGKVRAEVDREIRRLRGLENDCDEQLSLARKAEQNALEDIGRVERRIAAVDAALAKYVEVVGEHERAIEEAVAVAARSDQEGAIERALGDQSRASAALAEMRPTVQGLERTKNSLQADLDAARKLHVARESETREAIAALAAARLEVSKAEWDKVVAPAFKAAIALQKARFALDPRAPAYTLSLEVFEPSRVPGCAARNHGKGTGGRLTHDDVYRLAKRQAAPTIEDALAELSALDFDVPLSPPVMEPGEG